MLYLTFGKIKLLYNSIDIFHYPVSKESIENYIKHRE